LIIDALISSSSSSLKSPIVEVLISSIRDLIENERADEKLAKLGSRI